MEFTINREIFMEAIQRTLGIVEKKTTMPILNNVLLKAGQDGLTVNATDLEIGLTATYGAQVAREGDTTLSARKLHEMVREMQGDTIHFVRSDRDMVTMTCNRAVYRMQGLSAEDFPRVVEEEGVTLFQISGRELARLIRKTAFAISTDPLRKNLTGVLLEVEKKEGGDGGVVKMVATDGHRLAMATLPQDRGEIPVQEKGIIIPRKGLFEIRKNVEEVTGDVAFGFHKSMCILKTDQMTLKVRLIDGDYPDYRRVLPAERGVQVQFEKDKVLHALRRMKVISSDSYQGVIMKLSADKMVLNSTNPDVGEASDEIDVLYQERDLELAYNVNFLIEAIEVIDEKDVVFEMGGPKKAGVLKGLGNDHYFSVIMPLRF